MVSEKKSLFFGVATVVILGVAAYFTLGYFRGGNQPPSDYKTYGVCLSCEEEATVEHGASERAPFACSSCGEKAVFGWYYCQKCNKRFVPELLMQQGQWRQNPNPTCPNCRGSDVSAYFPIVPGQEPEGDLPLPSWPPE